MINIKTTSILDSNPQNKMSILMLKLYIMIMYNIKYT